MCNKFFEKGQTKALWRVASILLVAIHIYMYGGVASVSAAVMTSPNFRMEIDSINIGGVRQSSTNYFAEETIGEIGTGKILGSTFNLFGGFLLPAVVGVAPPPPPPPPGGGGGGNPPFLTGLQILDIVMQSITADTATVSWRTNKLASFELHYGIDIGYGNTTQADDFQTSRTGVLSSLSPDTTYHFEIVAEAEDGESVTSGDQTFETLPVPGFEPPLNISNFEAIGEDEQIRLQWENPPTTEFQGVRLVRKTEFYPVHPSDGELAYDGVEEAALDTDLQNGVRYYYTGFAYDTDGNFASGMISSAIPQKIIPGIPPPTVPPEPPQPPVIPPELVPPGLLDLDLLDFDFIQEGEKLPIIDGKVKVKPLKPLTISINYEKLPEVLKTILVTLSDKDDKIFPFLLRVNDEKTRYLATLAPPDPGRYTINFTVVDFKNQGLKKVTGNLEITPAPTVPSGPEPTPAPEAAT